MSALTLDTVKNAALIGAAVFVVGSVVAAVLLRTIAQKLAVAAIFALVALLLWTQRASLESCAELVRDAAGSPEATTCTFFGRDVEIPGRPGS